MNRVNEIGAVIKTKIATINTWKCDGHYWERMIELARQLNELHADIIVCQECFNSEEAKANTLLFLSRKLGMNYIKEKSRFKKRKIDNSLVDSSSGLGVLSKYQINKVATHRLADNGEDEDRIVLQVLAELPNGKTLMVTNTHLTHLPDLNLQRKQAEHLADIVLLNAKCDYHIVGGDFNSTINSEIVRRFIEKTHAIDCYAEGDGEEPRYSLLDSLLVGEHLCLDHLFLIPGCEVKISNAKIVLNKKQASGVYPSDHFGIMATLVYQ